MVKVLVVIQTLIISQAVFDHLDQISVVLLQHNAKDCASDAINLGKVNTWRLHQSLKCSQLTVLECIDQGLPFDQGIGLVWILPIL